MYDHLLNTLTQSCLTLHDLTVLFFGAIFFTFFTGVLFVMGSLLWEARRSAHTIHFQGLEPFPAPNVKKSTGDF